MLAHRAEDAVALAVFTAMVLLALLEIMGRAALGVGVPGSIVLVQHLTLWIALVGAALAARSDRLLALSTPQFLPGRIRGPVRVFTSLLASGITAVLSVASVDLVRIERDAGSVVAWNIPSWVAFMVLPAGFTLITGRLIWHAAEVWPGRFVAAVGLVIPAAVGSLWADGTPVNAVPGETYRLTTSPMLPAIPLFALGGYILAAGNASRRLMRLFSALFGWMPGGLAVVVTLVLAFFTPLTGASGVTILSMGGLLLPVLVGSGYAQATSIGLVTVSGSIGLLFFPSLPYSSMRSTQVYRSNASL